MSDMPPFTPSPAFDRAAQALDLGMESFWFNEEPAEHAQRLAGRVTLTAALLAATAGLEHNQALDAVAQALRFTDWPHLSGHLARAANFNAGPLPAGWLDALSALVVLTVVPEDEVSLPAAQLNAFEALGETLSMLTDAPKQQVLDGVSAVLCGGRSWHEVRHRNPLNASAPLYHFVVDDDAEGGVGGRFEESPACRQLIEQLDNAWQGYDDFTKPQKKRARAWVETALAHQPGFLEAGLALAWMQRVDDPAKALAITSATLRQAEALIPKGFKGRVLWGHLGNRFYHRLLWLQLQLNHEQGQAGTSARIARKLLRRNPGDNFGVRYVLPLLLLEIGDVAAARRALKAVADEHGLIAAAMRAFVAFAEDKPAEFRHELATALFTLPILRAFLLDDDNALPPQESGYRMVQSDIETFSDFAWPSYCSLPGLRRACKAWLAEPAVLEAEQALRTYWAGYWEARYQPGATQTGSAEGWQQLLTDCIERVAPAGRKDKG